MKNLLTNINTPQDIKHLSVQQLNDLAAEIRSFLINSVSESGGHLAANLGVVELTLALHYVFNSPIDKIVWDVGHQSYVHKILTGRKDQMQNLRQFGGLSGFPKFEESEHDVFNTGHSSTSISAALGLALARDLAKDDYAVVAVTGDGALTGGMCYEALNHAGNEGCDLLVILNDNEMSISRNVGAMSSYLNRLRTDPSYFRTKDEIETVLTRIPGIGPNIARAAGRFKDTLKFLMVPGKLFEELGFTYIGPVDGHDMQELLTVLSNARSMRGPVLIHTITQKGHGYAPAYNNPDVFHGVGPFDVKTGKLVNKKVKTYTEVFSDFIMGKAEEDPRVVAITAAMASGTGLKGFAQRYPERFFDVGICEAHAVTLAAGMARNGLRPVVCIYSTFLQRAYDQIIHDVALQNLPVVFAVDRAGLVGEDGPTHHGVFDLAYLRQIPNITVMAPADENEFTDMLYTAFKMEGPVAIRYPRGAGQGVAVEAEREFIPAGQAVTLHKGKDLAIMAIGRAVVLGLEVQSILQKQGISAELVNMRYVKPLDQEKVHALAGRFSRMVTIEDNNLAGGFGSAVLESLMDQHQSADVLRFGIKDEFVEHGRVDRLFEYLDLDPESMVEKIIQQWPDLLGKKKWELFRFGKAQG